MGDPALSLTATREAYARPRSPARPGAAETAGHERWPSQGTRPREQAAQGAPPAGSDRTPDLIPLKFLLNAQASTPSPGPQNAGRRSGISALAARPHSRDLHPVRSRAFL